MIGDNFKADIVGAKMPELIKSTTLWNKMRTWIFNLPI